MKKSFPRTMVSMFILIIPSILFIYTWSCAASVVKVAAIQYRAEPSKKIYNIRNLEMLIHEAASKGAKIIVLPELCTTGFVIRDAHQAHDLGETIPGPTTQKFAALAKEHSCYIIFGLLEFNQGNGKYFNSQIIIDDDGHIIRKYRKIHLYGTDYNWASTGDLGYQYVNTKYGKIGLGICYDINFEDMLSFFSAKHIDIFAFSTNWVAEELPFSYWLNLLKGRRYYFIAANNWGREGGINFSSGSIIRSLDGQILSKAESSSNKIIYSDLNLPQKSMKILLTGFEPFAGYSTNSSWEAIRRFDKRKFKEYSIKSVLLPVEYIKSKDKFLNVVASYDPDIIISFGLAEGSFIRLERQAKNDVGQFKDNIGYAPRSKYIIINSSPQLESRLPLNKIYDKLLSNNIKVEYSLDAGSYVCNYIFYHELIYGDKSRKRDSIGFIHLPPVSKEFDETKLEQIVELILDAVVE